MNKHAFLRNPQVDCVAHRELVVQKDTGAHRFFRMSGPKMQERFAALIDHETIPKILIHGNPHLANYCKTRRGAAMTDFDRSRIGPYAYDIVRFMISAALSQAHAHEAWLHPIIIEHFRRGYLYGFSTQTKTFEEMSSLRDRAPKSWQESTNQYLDSGKKWARRLNANQVKITKRLTSMLKSYLGNRDELALLNRYQLQSCAEVPGSMGKLHHLYLLVDRRNKKDAILIDIKEVYEEADNDWYHNPFKHHGKRMNVAGELYAPGWEQRPGRSSYDGQQFWVRQIPTQQAKLTIPLTQLELCDLCYAVGSQLGSGHSRAGDKKTRRAIGADFESRFNEYMKLANKMRKELLSAHKEYTSKVKKKSLLSVVQ